MEKIYDIIIIGQGIAGMTSAIYARRAGADVLILEKNAVGGQASLSYEIANYPGFENVSGFELVSNIEKQVKALGVEVRYANVLEIENGQIKKVKTKDDVYKAKSIILCLGASPRKLGIENEEKFVGRGVSYCAVCDGAFFRGKEVAVVGRGNSAVEETNYLAKLAKKVYLLNRKKGLKAQEILVDELDKLVEEGKVEIISNSEVVDVLGENRLEQLQLKNNVSNERTLLNVNGVFVAVGRIPDTEFVKDLVELDESGFVKVDEYKRTSVEGIYSAGDCTNTVLRQLITSASDGAVAGTYAWEYAKNIKVD